MGVRQILAPCAVGSLRAEMPPGAVVVPDQLLNRTSGRAGTFHDGPTPAHISFADPYCPAGRNAVLATSGEGMTVADGGTMVVVEASNRRKTPSWVTAVDASMPAS